MVKTRTRIAQKSDVELIRLAMKRIDFDDANINLSYQADADLLNIRFSDAKIVNSKMDIESGVIRSFDKTGKLVNLEILDLYGIFATT